MTKENFQAGSFDNKILSTEMVTVYSRALNSYTFNLHDLDNKGRRRTEVVKDDTKRLTANGAITKRITIFGRNESFKKNGIISDYAMTSFISKADWAHLQAEYGSCHALRNRNIFISEDSQSAIAEIKEKQYEVLPNMPLTKDTLDSKGIKEDTKFNAGYIA